GWRACVPAGSSPGGGRPRRGRGRPAPYEPRSGSRSARSAAAARRSARGGGRCPPPPTRISYGDTSPWYRSGRVRSRLLPSCLRCYAQGPGTETTRRGQGAIVCSTPYGEGDLRWLHRATPAPPDTFPESTLCPSCAVPPPVAEDAACTAT